MEQQQNQNGIKVYTKEEIAKTETIFNEQQLNFLLQKTPANHVFKRPGKGGQQWEYVTGTYIQKVLNFMFGWNWDFIIEKFDVNEAAKQVIVLGKLVCRTGDKEIVKQQFGRNDIAIKKGTGEYLDLGNDLKGAATDALKKCASEIGIASDIYGKGEFKEIRIQPKDQFEHKKNEVIEKLDEKEKQGKDIQSYRDEMVSLQKKKELTIEKMDEILNTIENEAS